MRSRTAAALVAILACGSWAAAQTPAGVESPAATVRLSPVALRRRAVTCQVPPTLPQFHLRRMTPVNVEILIDEKGRVRSAKVVSGHPLLHASAVQTAWKWTFRPVRVKGRRVTAGGVLTLYFSSDAGEMEKQCKGLRRRAS